MAAGRGQIDKVTDTLGSASSNMTQKVHTRVSIPASLDYAKKTALHNWVALAVIVGIVVSVACAVMLYGLSIQQSSPCSDAGMASIAFVVLVFIALLAILGWSLHNGHRTSDEVKNDVTSFRARLDTGRARHRDWAAQQFDYGAQHNLMRRMVDGFQKKVDG